MPTNLNFALTKSVPLILQSEITECGLELMGMVVNYHGHKLDMPIKHNTNLSLCENDGDEKSTKIATIHF